MPRRGRTTGRRPSRRWVAAAAILSVWLLAACGGGGGKAISDHLLVVRQAGIVELALSTGDEHLLLENPEGSLLVEPALSPDRRTIAYVRQLNPIVVPGERAELGFDLFFANRDGSNQHVVAEHQQPNDEIRAPSWFPDGRRLLVNTERLVNAQFQTDVEVLDVATGQRTVVAQGALRPAVSHDGQRVVFVRQDASLVETLWMANADGSDAHVIAGPDDALGGFNSPRFSPDDTQLAFGAAPLLQSNSGGNAYVSRAPLRLLPSASNEANNGLPMNIWIMDVAGGAKRMLAQLELDLPSVAWSSDGARIFALGGNGIYAVDPKGGSRRLGEGTFHGQLDWLSPN